MLYSQNVSTDILRLGPEPYSVEVDLMRPIDPEASPKVGELDNVKNFCSSTPGLLTLVAQYFSLHWKGSQASAEPYWSLGG